MVGEVTHPKNRKQAFLDRWLPGSLGGVAGFAAFNGMGTASGGSLQRLPYIWPSNLGEDLGSLSAGLLGDSSVAAWVCCFCSGEAGWSSANSWPDGPGGRC